MKKSAVAFCISLACAVCAGERGPVRGATRVMSYNIRVDTASDRNTPNRWDRRRDELVALIRRDNPDVIGFQEVLPGQREFLEKSFPDYSFVGHGRDSNYGGEACPVAYCKSRFDAVSSGTFWLSDTPEKPGSRDWNSACPRICTYAVLQDKTIGGRFCIANTHTDHVSSEAREKGMALVFERMPVFAKGVPCILTGDHNCLENSPPAKYAASRMASAVHASETPPSGPWRTFNGFSPAKKTLSAEKALKLPPGKRDADGGGRIDYIYVSRGLRVLSCRTLDDVRKDAPFYPSDHMPVSADIVRAAGIK